MFAKINTTRRPENVFGYQAAFEQNERFFTSTAGRQNSHSRNRIYLSKPSPNFAASYFPPQHTLNLLHDYDLKENEIATSSNIQNKFTPRIKYLGQFPRPVFPLDLKSEQTQ